MNAQGSSVSVNVVEISVFAERWRADLLLGRLALAIGARLGAVDAGFDVTAVEPGGDEDQWDLVDQWRQLNAGTEPPKNKGLHKVRAWFTGELRGAGDDAAETADEDESLAIILDALDGLAQAGVGESELDYDGANPDHVPFGDVRHVIELPAATMAKGADLAPDVAAAVRRLRGLVAAGRGPAPEVTSIQMRSRAAFDEARSAWRCARGTRGSTSASSSS